MCPSYLKTDRTFVTVPMPVPMKELLQLLCAQERRSMADYIRLLIEERLDMVDKADKLLGRK